jgi:hypothetical protein
MVAMLTKQPHMNISEKESVILAKGIREVLARYNFAPNPTAAAWLQLGLGCAMIYTPRVLIIAAERKQAKQAQAPINPLSSTGPNVPPVATPNNQQPGPQNVTPIFRF